MTLERFRRLLACALYKQSEICHILNSNNSLLASCDDESNFYINILESKRTFTLVYCKIVGSCQRKGGW